VRFRRFPGLVFAWVAVVSVVLLVTGVVSVLVLPSAAGAAPPAAGSGVSGSAGVSTLGASGDVAVQGWGDERGYHLEVGRGSAGYVWQEVAVLQPLGLDEPSWTGYQCVSGDGAYAAVVVEPTSVVSVEADRDRGAVAYSVALSSGVVRPVASGVALT
jgi:hypothetical protein